MKCRVLSTRWADVDVGLCRKELGCLQRFQVVGGLPRFWESWTLSRPSTGKTDVQPTLVDTIIDREDSITHNKMTDACICVKQVLGAQFGPRPPSPISRWDMAPWKVPCTRGMGPTRRLTCLAPPWHYPRKTVKTEINAKFNDGSVPKE